jgi:type II secretory pathway pseudopilin PulG
MKRRPAFTFLELLIALALFAGGMMTMLQIFPLNRRFLTQSALTTQATFLGQEEMETVRSVAYEDLTVGTYEAKHAVSSGDAFSQFQRETTVALLDASRQPTATDTGLKKITVTVYWMEKNVSRHLTIATYAYEK